MQNMRASRKIKTLETRHSKLFSKRMSLFMEENSTRELEIVQMSMSDLPKAIDDDIPKNRPGFEKQYHKNVLFCPYMNEADDEATVDFNCPETDLDQSLGSYGTYGLNYSPLGSVNSIETPSTAGSMSNSRSNSRSYSRSNSRSDTQRSNSRSDSRNTMSSIATRSSRLEPINIRVEDMYYRVVVQVHRDDTVLDLKLMTEAKLTSIYHQQRNHEEIIEVVGQDGKRIRHYLSKDNPHRPETLEIAHLCTQDGRILFDQDLVSEIISANELIRVNYKLSSKLSL